MGGREGGEGGKTIRTGGSGQWIFEEWDLGTHTQTEADSPSLPNPASIPIH